MNWTKLQRKWHTWAGAALALPVIVVGLTSIFIAHEGALGTDEVRLDAVPLPGYSRGARRGDILRELEDIKASLRVGETTYLGTKVGLVRVGEDSAEAVRELAGVEVRALALSGDRLYAGGKQGLWWQSEGTWVRLHEGDVHGVEADGSHLFLSLGKHGMEESRDGGATWTKSSLASAVRQAAPGIVAAAADRPYREPLTLKKVILDLHTGEAFLGKRYAWLWIDLVGLAVVVLVGSGIYVWWSSLSARRRKAA